MTTGAELSPLCLWYSLRVQYEGHTCAFRFYGDPRYQHPNVLIHWVHIFVVLQLLTTQ